MKPHLEERNERMYEEYHRRVLHEVPQIILAEIAPRERLSLNTTRIICTTRKYGTYGKRKSKRSAQNKP